MSVETEIREQNGYCSLLTDEPEIWKQNDHCSLFAKKMEIRMQNGCSRLLVDDQVIMPMAFTSVEEVPSDYLQNLGKAGVKLFFLICDLPWMKQKGLDPENLERQLDQLQKLVPGAKVILRINLHPPLWWMEQNPDELVRLGNNQLLRIKYLSFCYRHSDIPVYSLVSDKWRYDAGIELQKFIALIDRMPSGNSVIGHFMGAGRTAEWAQCNLGQGIDHGKAFKKHFSSWLKNKYKNVENLRQAWNQPDIDFDDIPIPSLEQKSGHYNGGNYCCNQFDEAIRKGKNKYVNGGFTNLKESQAAFDFMLALHHGVAESIEYFCKIAKECSNGRLLTGAFHGDMLHTGVRNILLPSKYIDFLASPGDYFNRLPGEITNVRCPNNSYALHNKIFFMEDDTRTHLAAPQIRKKYGANSLADSITKMKRDFGRNICQNLYGWWFDMHVRMSKEFSWMSNHGLMNGGNNWYNSPEIFKLIRRQQQIAESAKNRDCRRVSSIAVIMDAKSVHTATHAYLLNAGYWRAGELSRIGAPIDYYYCDDLDNPNMPDYKLYIFLNVFMLDDKQRQKIKNKICRNNSTALWMHASGVFNPDARELFSHSNIEDLSGIRMRYDSQEIETTFDITMPEHQLITACDVNHKQGRNKRNRLQNFTGQTVPGNQPNNQMPNFYPDDNSADILGRFSDNEAPALACRDFQTWRSIYCSTQFIGSDLLRSIAKNAGCHIVCDTDDFIFMNNSYLTIHAAHSGLKTLSFAEPRTPIELYTNEKYGENISEFTIKIKEGETLMFSI